MNKLLLLPEIDTQVSLRFLSCFAPCACKKATRTGMMTHILNFFFHVWFYFFFATRRFDSSFLNIVLMWSTSLMMWEENFFQAFFPVSFVSPLPYFLLVFGSILGTLSQLNVEKLSLRSFFRLSGWIRIRKLIYPKRKKKDERRWKSKLII